MEAKLQGSQNPVQLEASDVPTFNPLPQNAPGAHAAVGHTLENSIPLSIFPIATDKFCFCFCGLPGRGKTQISRRLARYLAFFHAIPVIVFNVSEYRIKMFGAIHDADWFDSSNVEAQRIREEANSKIIDDMIEFLNSHPNGVAIMDSTNPTHDRRKRLVDKLRITGAKITFIEVMNENIDFLDEQCKQAVLGSPDYADVGSEEAEKDYRLRLAKYRMIFETLDSPENHEVEKNWSYFKCDHDTRHFVVHRVGGYLPLKVVHFIMNMQTQQHSYYLSRHGQSEYNEVGRIGGDSGLTQHGLNYAKKLAEFVDVKIAHNEAGEDVPARLWTSTLRRTRETAQFIAQQRILVKDRDDPSLACEWVQMRPRAWHHLDELFAGSCDGMTYEEIEEKFPEEFGRRNTDKLAYRYPRGESYLDVIARLEPIVIEMERHTEPLLIVAHQGILRIIYAFYMGLSRAEAPYVSVPLNTVLEIRPSAFTCAEKRHVLYTPAKALHSDGQDEKKPSLRHRDSIFFTAEQAAAAAGAAGGAAAEGAIGQEAGVAAAHEKPFDHDPQSH